MSLKPLAYTLDPIHRAAMLRTDDGGVRALLAGGRARFVAVWNQRHPVNDASEPHIFGAELLARLDPAASPVIFLGIAKDEPWFAVGLPDSDAPPDLGIASKFVPLLEIAALLPGPLASTMAYGRAMVIWHHNHRHCGRCGAPAAVTESGHSRTCTSDACKHRSFPRVDPAMITLISHGDRCLLGRQPSWPAGMYSTIAGFVEPGETLENAVRREVEEETGIKVGEVRYIASQPWPFPSSIMLGFRGEAITTDIHCDDQELEDCRWFTRDEVRTFGERDSPHEGFKLPNRISISRFLVEGWLAEG